MSNQAELNDLALVLSRYPEAWYLEYVNGRVAILDRRGDSDGKPVGSGENRTGALKAAAESIREQLRRAEVMQEAQRALARSKSDALVERMLGFPSMEDIRREAKSGFPSAKLLYESIKLLVMYGKLTEEQAYRQVVSNSQYTGVL